MSDQSKLVAELERRLAQERMGNFVQYTFPGYDMLWQHEVICEALDRVVNHESNRVILQMGPRFGKTELVWRRCAPFYLGKYPDRSVMTAAYGEELSNKNTRDVKRIMRSPAYQRLFPNTIIDGKDSSSEFELSAGGSYRSAGVGQGIGGFGANLLICDDLFRNRQVAESQAERDRVWEWLNDDAFARLEYPNAVVLMFTRWHYDDAIGRILQSPEAQDWEVLSFPAILDDVASKHPRDPRSEGEPLLKGLKPKLRDTLSFDERAEIALDELEKKREMNSYGFEALYQCNPTPRAGGLFKREWMKHYQASPEHIASTCEEVMISVDATFGKGKQSDKVAMCVLGRRGQDYFVLDERFARMDFPETKQALMALQRKWTAASSTPVSVLIEAKANGQALISELRGAIPRVLDFEPGKNSKESRAQMAANCFEAGQIYLPEPLYCPWIGDWIEDFAGFPSRKFDDRIDALSQACIRWAGVRGPLTHLRRILGWD